MSAENVPEWAIEKAHAALKVEAGIAPRFETYTRSSVPVLAFARYIASHEEPPVDPLLVEAREIVATTQHNYPDSPWHVTQCELLREGRQDKYLTVMAAYEGLRRGMELARNQGEQP